METRSWRLTWAVVAELGGHAEELFSEMGEVLEEGGELLSLDAEATTCALKLARTGLWVRSKQGPSPTERSIFE